MSPFGGFGGGGIFTFVPYFIAIIFVIVIGAILFRAISGIKQWKSNNAQPVLTVPAKIVSKRTKVSRRTHHNNNHHHHTSSTYYYVTFEVESADRMELRVHEKDYGILAEGDIGSLTFQGTRFKGFERSS